MAGVGKVESVAGSERAEEWLVQGGDRAGDRRDQGQGPHVVVVGHAATRMAA